MSSPTLPQTSIQNYLNELVHTVRTEFQLPPYREIIATNIGIKSENERRTGNTTRQVDYAIQALFSGAVVICIDHASDLREPYNYKNINLNRLLFEKILRRLSVEHQSTYKYVIHNMKNFVIYLQINHPEYERVKKEARTK